MTSAVEQNVTSAVALPPSKTQALFRLVVGVVMIALGIGCQIAGAGFPYNAPVEMIYNFFITVSLIGGGIALLVFALVASRRASTPTVIGRFSPLVLAGAVLVGVALVAWLITAPGSFIGHATDGGRQRFMELTVGLALAGAPWGVGMVMSAVGFRAPSRASRIVACIALGVGVLLAIAAIYSAAIYSAGLTD